MFSARRRISTYNVHRQCVPFRAKDASAFEAAWLATVAQSKMHETLSLRLRLLHRNTATDPVSHCSNGLPGFEGENENGKACCPLECTKCGGAACYTAGAAAGLDETSCCITSVLNNQELCSVAGEAPCKVDDGASVVCAQLRLQNLGSYHQHRVLSEKTKTQQRRRPPWFHKLPRTCRNSWCCREKAKSTGLATFALPSLSCMTSKLLAVALGVG